MYAYLSSKLEEMAYFFAQIVQDSYSERCVDCRQAAVKPDQRP